MPGSQLWHASTWRFCLVEMPRMWWQKKKRMWWRGSWAQKECSLHWIISQGSSWLIVLDFHRLDYSLKEGVRAKWLCNLGETFQAGLCQGFRNLKMDESRPRFSTPNAVKLFKADDFVKVSRALWTEFNPEGLEDGKAKRHWFWKVTALWVKDSFWFPKAEGVSCIYTRKQCTVSRPNWYEQLHYFPSASGKYTLAMWIRKKNWKETWDSKTMTFYKGKSKQIIVSNTTREFNVNLYFHFCICTCHTMAFGFCW